MLSPQLKKPLSGNMMYEARRHINLVGKGLQNQSLRSQENSYIVNKHLNTQETSRNRSITNNKKKNTETSIQVVKQQQLNRSRSNSKKVVTDRENYKSPSRNIKLFLNDPKKKELEKKPIKTFSKLGKVKIDLNSTNPKTTTLNTKKSIQETISSKPTLIKPRSTSQLKVSSKPSNGGSQASLLKAKSQEIFSQILPDFASMDGLSNSFLKSDEIGSFSNVLLDLPEISYNHLQGMIAFSIEELKSDRLALANKIAHTFRVKKKIPATTPEYYRLCYVIGRGAFAKVCLGVQVLTAKLVAMKIIEKGSLKSENAKKRIVQEVMMLKQLAAYSQIIKLYEVFETKKQIFIIMEYIEGGDLMKFVKDNGPQLKENEAKQIFVQTVCIMHILQTHSILHRDIKLDNLLINKGQVKVCDFGVSKLVVKGQKILEQCGTPAYLAPEIITCKTGYEGYSSDVWSLGVVLYIILVGKVPFKGNSMNELNQNIQNGVLNFMEIKQAGLNNDSIDLIKKMLTVNPKQRIALQDIIEHPWIRNDVQNPLKKVFDIQKQKKSNFDPKIINHIEALGYQKEYIYKCLQKQSLSHINALYTALLT